MVEAVLEVEVLAGASAVVEDLASEQVSAEEGWVVHEQVLGQVGIVYAPAVVP